MTDTDNVMASLAELWQRRDENLDRLIVDWAGKHCSPEKANELIGMIRKSLSAIDVKNELAILAATLPQPTTTPATLEKF